MAMPPMVNGCNVDPERLAPLRPCMESCGPEKPRDDWDQSCIHPQTVAYSCGRLAYPGGPNDHDHDPEELIRCRTLAAEAADVIAGVEINLSEASSTLDAFFSTANRGDTATELTPEVVRTTFGGTIYPSAKIIVEPFGERGLAWQNFVAISPEEYANHPTVYGERLEAAVGNARREWQRRFELWRPFLDWFQSHQGLRSGSFVMVGDRDLSDQNFGCVFPRLVLGLTPAGSLVGVCGHAVHT